jgi:hypothetical protein
MSPDSPSTLPVPQKKRCLALTKAGRPCRAWALAGSQDRFGVPLCATHAGQATVTQPAEETERALYGHFFRPADLQALDAVLAGPAGATTLAAEIEVARVFMRRVLEVLEEMAAQDPAAVLRQGKLLLEVLRTIARLVRDQQAMAPPAGDPIMEAIGLALDEISEEWGIRL